jgi:hypothetical protein
MRAGALIVAIASVAAIAAPAQGQTARTPTLKVVDTHPLVVAGTGFVPRERVTVTALTSLGPRFVPTRATARGAFRVLVGRFTQPCGKPFAVRARGTAGSRAMVLLEALPCVPPPIG